MKKSKANRDGFIAIVSILIVTTIAMFFAMGMLLDGVNNASLSLNSIFYETSRLNANTCIEDVYWRIKQEHQYAANLNYQITPDDSCTATLQWFSEQTVGLGITERLATLDVTGMSNGFSRQFQHELRIETYDVLYSNVATIDHYNTIEILSITEL